MLSERSRLVNIRSLSDHTGLGVRTVRTFMARRLIPFFKFGHRTVLFDPAEVDKALRRFEIRAVGDDDPRRKKTTA